MILDINYLINFFDKHSGQSKDSELDEQDAAAPPSGGGGSGKAVPKWSDSYALKRGKANMLWKGGEKWSTGMTRGAANQIW